MLKFICLQLSMIILINLSALSFAQTINSEKFQIQELANTEMEDGYSYFLHFADDKYLVYAEQYTLEIFVYDLEEEMVVLRKIIENGKGPYELTTITGAIIVDDYIYVSSMREPKVIQISLKNEELKESRLDNVIVRSLRKYNGDIIIENNDITNLFVKYDVQNKTIDRLDFNGFDPITEFSNTPFFKEGDFTLIGNRMIFTTTYMPHIYILDLENKNIGNYFAFDEANVKAPRQVNIGGGQVAIIPPESNFYTTKIIKKPGYDNKAFILTEGEGKEKVYTYNNLYEIDLIQGNISGTLPFHSSISSAVSNDEFVFIYTGDYFKLYKLKINE